MEPVSATEVSDNGERCRRDGLCYVSWRGLAAISAMRVPPFFAVLVIIVTGASSGVADLAHRWSFNEAATSAVANETTLMDTVSSSALVIRSGVNDATTRRAAFTGTAVTLPGSTSGNFPVTSISAYLDLENGIISSKPNLTVEAWITPVSSRSWQRLFDFGRTNTTAGPNAATGEITTPSAAPGLYAGFDNVMLSLNNLGTLGNHRLEGRLAGGTSRAVDVTPNPVTAVNTEYHFVMTVTDRAGAFGNLGCQLAWYRNATLQRTLDLAFRLPDISDVNNWIGRSNFSGDSCSNITINELRIYNHALSAAQITSSFTAGPNPSFTAPIANADAQTMHRNAKARIGVLANDTGSTSNATVAIVTPPAFGTAVPQADGRILYTHTTGSPAGDSFTYRVGGPAGMSSPATVTITFANSLRIANAGLNVPTTPPPTSVQFVNAFAGLTFSAPICLRSIPGNAQRLFVVERNSGLRLVPDVTATAPQSVQVFTMTSLLAGRTPAETQRTDGENGFLSIALHPSFATNGYVFLFYSVQYNSQLYQRVSRVTLANPTSAAPTLVASSERVLIAQIDEQTNHNGGDLHFGPDGYLYVSLGDEGAQSDTQNNSERIDKDFFCAILRIDVDKRPGNLEPKAHPNPAASSPAVNAIPRDEIPVGSNNFFARYSIPIDNPFVRTSEGGTWNGTYNGAAISAANLPYVRSEFWATGMRNPWRMSFDAPTGELWVGDVGGGAREEVNVVVKGGNYGWAFREGNVAGPKVAQTPGGFTSLPPVYEYLHGTGTFLGDSITGGVVYRGTRFPTLTGAYIFADYVDGHVWSLRRTPTLDVQRLLGETNVVAFGLDPSNGDVLACSFGAGNIRRLVVESAPGSFPGTLSATNLFADLTDLAPAPSLLPYEVNLPFWSDHAIKSRWFTIPTALGTMTWSRDGAWTFPNGQIWVKHFDMEMTRGTPATKKRIETRVFVKNSTGAYGVSYQWNDAGTEAYLVPDAGAEFDLSIIVAGSPTVQRWNIPSRTQCITCHTPQAGHALSSDTRQFNLTNTIRGFTGNQLTLLQNAGYFANSPGSPNLLPRHLRPDETAYPVEARVRSYLAVNCAYCHKAGGTALPSAWDGRHELALEATGLINGNASNNGGSTLNKLISVTGNASVDTARSIVLNRVAVANGFTRMPSIGSNVTDQTNVDLLTEWIVGALPNRQSYADWRLATFHSSTSSNGAPTANADGDAADNNAEFLAGTNALNGGSFLAPRVSIAGGNATVQFTVSANRSVTVETTTDFAAWSLWDVAGNAGLPTSGGTLSLSGPMLGGRQFFRLRLREN